MCLWTMIKCMYAVLEDAPSACFRRYPHGNSSSPVVFFLLTITSRRRSGPPRKEREKGASRPLTTFINHLLHNAHHSTFNLSFLGKVLMIHLFSSKTTPVFPPSSKKLATSRNGHFPPSLPLPIT
ncbi:hypothetical protein L249_7803, partial [Ophiocordyceps polyrhachis-furcata BCC 54312]